MTLEQLIEQRGVRAIHVSGSTIVVRVDDLLAWAIDQMQQGNLLPGAAMPKQERMDPDLKKWLEEHLLWADNIGESVVPEYAIRDLFDGKVLVDANKDASCAAAMERELSAIQSTISSFKSPGEALRALIDWHCAVAVDPAVNGGNVLVPVERINKAHEWADSIEEKICRQELTAQQVFSQMRNLLYPRIAASQEQKQ